MHGSLGKFIVKFNPQIDTEYIYKPIINCKMGFTTATISDTNGKIVFFTDGFRVYGSNYEMAVNGDTINPGKLWELYFGSSYPEINGAYFLPFPDHLNEYYLIHKRVTFFTDSTIIGREDPIFCNKLYYTLLKANNNNGITLEKNITLLDTLISDSEMAACKHGNGRDYWLVIKLMGLNVYYFYLIDPNGIRLSHIQAIGIAHTKNDWNGNSVFSKDGKKFARVLPEDGIEIFDFDRCKGLFYNPKHAVFPDTNLIISSVELSASGRYAYVTSLNSIWQYDLQPENIESGRLLIDQWDSILSPFDNQMYYLRFFQARRADDDKIYISHFGGNQYLHRIAEPDELGLACKSENYAVILPAYMSGSLPMFPNFKLGTDPNCSLGEKDVLDNKIDEEEVMDEISFYDLTGRELIKYNSMSILEIRNLNELLVGIYLARITKCNNYKVSYLKLLIR